MGLCCGLLRARIKSKYLIHRISHFPYPLEKVLLLLLLWNILTILLVTCFRNPGWHTNNPFYLLGFQDSHLSIMRHPLTHQASPRHRRLTQVLGPLPLSPSWAISSTPCRSTATVNGHSHCSFRALCGVEDDPGDQTC